MTILLYNDGRLVIDDGNPLEGAALEGLLACVTDPKEGDVLTFDGSLWVNQPQALPASVTEPADGDTLAYDEESGTWKNVHAEE